MSRHAQAMDAVAYWRQFVTAFYFDKPGDEVAGVVLDLVEPDRKDPTPALKIQTRDGRVYVVTGYQARLRAELVKQAPAVGDAIKITYHGEAKSSAPGMNRAKEFTVVVRRQGSQSGAGAEAVSGEVAGSENEPRAGSKAT